MARQVNLIKQRGDTDCGPAALDMMLTRWGARTSALRIGGQQAVGDGGATAGQLRDEARHLGFQSFVFQGSVDDLTFEIGVGRPVLVGLVREVQGRRSAHFVVVVGHDLKGSEWLVADPAAGWQVVPVGDLQRQWSEAKWVTLVLFPSDSADPSAGVRTRASL